MFKQVLLLVLGTMVAPVASADLPETDGEIVVTGSRLGRYVGHYALNGTIAAVSLTDDGRLTVALTGQSKGPPLRAVSANEFVADEVGVRLFFEGDGPKASRLRSQYRGGEVSGTRIADDATTDTLAAAKGAQVKSSWPADGPGAASIVTFQAGAETLVKSSWPADGPGAAAIVTEHGEIVFSGAQGLADVETGRPITVDTVFRLGSITKQFTAALLLKLVDDGKLSLDDPLSKFLPAYPEPGGHATIRQLLNHTSGIRSYTSLPTYIATMSRPHTTEQVIALFRNERADFEPGTDWRYDNSGYALLAAVVEAVTGQPWHVALTERITGPLGLSSIRYGVEEESIAARALPYSTSPGGVQLAPAIHMSVPSGAGALVGSVRDMARFAFALHHGKVVSAASYVQMIAPTALPNSRSVPYGFGLGTEELRGFKGIGHNGGINGGSTDSIYLPEKDLFVAVFTNSDRPQTPPGTVLRRLAALAAGNPFPTFEKTIVDVASLEPLFGVYALPGAGGEWYFYARGEQLLTRLGDSPEQPVFAAGNDRFFFGPGYFTWIEAKGSAAGTFTLSLHRGSADQVDLLVRKGPMPKPPSVAREVLERYVGRYQLQGTIATIGLTEDNQLTVQLTGQPAASPLRTVGPNEFAGDAVGVRLSFEGEEAKATTLKSRMGQLVNSGPRLPDGQ